MDNDSELGKMGKRCHVFDYTQKNILSIKDYEKKIWEEVAHVKILNDAGPWLLQDPKDTNENMCLDDDVTVLSGIGNVARKKLNTAGFFKIKDLIEADDDMLQGIIGITMVKMCKYREKSKKSCLLES